VFCSVFVYLTVTGHKSEVNLVVIVIVTRDVERRDILSSGSNGKNSIVVHGPPIKCNYFSVFKVSFYVNHSLLT